MRDWRAAVGICIGAALLAGCSAASRYKVLTTLFDGVPPPSASSDPSTSQRTARPSAVRSQQAGGALHGPYAAKLCNACHDWGAANALVAPGDQLCFRCHALPMNKKYVHGPLASGGCLVCHEPHGSRYRYLLVSESDGFCFQCHDRNALVGTAAHGGVEEQCTTCHDAHMSDREYLLR